MDNNIEAVFFGDVNPEHRYALVIPFGSGYAPIQTYKSRDDLVRAFGKSEHNFREKFGNTLIIWPLDRGKNLKEPRIITAMLPSSR